MKKWSVIIAATGLATWLVLDSIREFFANDAIHYFSVEPRRLLYVLAMAVIAGLGAFAFERLSVRAQWRIRLSAWGTAAGGLSASLAYLVFRLVGVFALVIESRALISVLLSLLLLSAIAAYFWFEFYRAWKRKVLTNNP